MAMAALLPGTVCVPLLAPASENWSCFTPEPPGLSMAVKVIVTLVLFQLFAFGTGAGVAVVVGGVVSAGEFTGWPLMAVMIGPPLPPGGTGPRFCNRAAPPVGQPSPSRGALALSFQSKKIPSV